MADLYSSCDYQLDADRKILPLKSCHLFLTRQKEREKLLNEIANTIRLSEERQKGVRFGYNNTLSVNCKLVREFICFLRSCAPCATSKKEPSGIVTRKTTMFTCKCGWLLFDPCSLPCGHTLCRSCVEDAGFCLICGSTFSEKIATNIFLANLLWKWFPREYKAASLKKEGKKLVREKEFEKAVEALCEALKLTPNDHIALLYRSEAKLNLGNKRDALDDAQLAVKLNQSCGQAYFRLGAAFTAMGHLDDAINAYQTCLELEPDDISLFKAVVENLDKLLAPPDPNDIDLSCHGGNTPPKTSDDPGMGSSISNDSEQRDPLSTPRTESSGSSRSLSSDPTTSGVEGEGSGSSPHNSSPAIFNLGDSHPSSKPNSSLSVTERNPLAPREEQVRRPNILSEMDGGCCSSTDLNDDTSCSNESSGSDSGSDEDGLIRSTTKRFRSPSPPFGHSQSTESKRPRKGKDVDHELDVEDFECKLCFNVLFQPVTTPCGHVFCKECLERCLDHKAVCPNCRAGLEGFLVDRKRVVTEIIEKTIEKYFPLDYRERKDIYDERMTRLARVGVDEDVEVPIFVCAMVLPTIQCPLHVFEPRYRLMLRECLESGSRKFGMCIETEHEGFSDVGTILEVRSVRYLEDGRAIIDAVGGRRFSVVSRSGRDGFDTAKVKYFDDEWPTESSEGEKLELNARYTLVYRQLSNYVSNLHPAERECIFNALGPLPQLDPCPKDYPNGVSWIWWALAALPLNNRAKEVLLRSRSLNERLASIQRFLRFLMRMNKPGARQSSNELNGNTSGNTNGEASI